MLSNYFSNFIDTSSFHTSEDSFDINEPDKQATIQNIAFFLKGCTFDYCPDGFWKLSEPLYKKNQDYSFRDHCDGFVYFKYDNQNYLVWIELKSSFNVVFEKAVFQISSCYIKMHSFINNFITLNNIPFREFGIIVSPPDSSSMGTTNENNDIVPSRRESLLHNNQRPQDIIRKRYRQTNKITVNYTDLGKPVSNLIHTIVPHNFPIVHIPASTKASSVDLLQIIQSLFH